MTAARLLPMRGTSEEPSNTSLHAAIYGTSITCMVLVSAFASARFIAKRSMSGFNVEDYLLMITWPMLLGFAIALMLSADYGVGDHVWNIAPNEITKIRKTDYAINIIYALTTWCGKTALLFQMQHIFCPVRSGFVYIASYVLVAAVSGIYSVVTLALIMQCDPIRKVWDSSVEEGRCLNEVAISIATGIFNVVTDFSVLGLPMWAIFRLKMPLRRKATVAAVFATGILACACSLCRLVYTFELENDADFIRSVAKLGISAVCEIASIILCTCFPLMPRFVQICKKTYRGRWIFNTICVGSESPSSKNSPEKMSTHDSCVFCDDDTACFIHTLSSNTSNSRLVEDRGLEMPASASPTTQRSDSETAPVGNEFPYGRNSGNVIVQQRFEVEHGVQTGDGNS